MGIMCYELLMGRTPFHAWKLEDLIAKINRGDYPVKVIDESLTAECALFLAQCLQSDEAQRIEADQLLEHPFLKPDRQETDIDKQAYLNALVKKRGKDVDKKILQLMKDKNIFVFNTHVQDQIEILQQIVDQETDRMS